MASGLTVALSDDLANHGAADPVSLGDFGQAHSVIAISKDSYPIDIEWSASDLATY